MGLNFGQVARSQAIAWKLSTPDLPEEAREPADFDSGSGQVIRGPFEFCLPPEYAAHNLLPEARDDALAAYAALGLRWRGGSDTGPSNHLLDTQVQLANALVPLLGDPARVARFLGAALPVAEVLPIEHDWYLTFGWAGLRDHLGEARDRPWSRAAAATKADAAVRYRSESGRTEVALIIWKYSESGTEARPTGDPLRDSRQGKERNRRVGRPTELEGSARKRNALQAHYKGLLPPADLPVRADVPWGDLFVDPFNELLRLQLLAALTERAHELDAEAVRLVFVAPSENLDLAFALNRTSHHRVGSTVPEVWSKLVIPPDRFAVLDSAVLVDEDLDLTSPSFRARYADLAG